MDNRNNPPGRTPAVCPELTEVGIARIATGAEFEKHRKQIFGVIKARNLRAENAAALLEYAAASTHKLKPLRLLMSVEGIVNHLPQIGAEKLFYIFKSMCAAHINQFVLYQFWKATQHILQPYLDSLPIEQRVDFLKLVLLSNKAKRVTFPMQSIIAAQTDYKVLDLTKQYMEENHELLVEKLDLLRQRIEPLQYTSDDVPDEFLFEIGIERDTLNHPVSSEILNTLPMEFSESPQLTFIDMGNENNYSNTLKRSRSSLAENSSGNKKKKTSAVCPELTEVGIMRIETGAEFEKHRKQIFEVIETGNLRAESAAALLEYAAASTHKIKPLRLLMSVEGIENHLPQIGAEKLFYIFQVMCMGYINQFVLYKFWEATQHILQSCFDSLLIEQRVDFLKLILLSNAANHVTLPMRSIIAAQTDYEVLGLTRQCMEENHELLVEQLDLLRQRMVSLQYTGDDVPDEIPLEIGIERDTLNYLVSSEIPNKKKKPPRQKMMVICHELTEDGIVYIATGTEFQEHWKKISVKIRDGKLSAESAAALLEHAAASSSRCTSLKMLMAVADIEQYLPQIDAETLFYIFQSMCTAHINQLAINKFWEATKHILQPYLDSLSREEMANFLVVVLSSTGGYVTLPMQSIIAIQTDYEVLELTKRQYLQENLKLFVVGPLGLLQQRMDELLVLIQNNTQPPSLVNTTPESIFTLYPEDSTSASSLTSLDLPNEIISTLPMGNQDDYDQMTMWPSLDFDPNQFQAPLESLPMELAEHSFDPNQFPAPPESLPIELAENSFDPNQFRAPPESLPMELAENSSVNKQGRLIVVCRELTEVGIARIATGTEFQKHREKIFEVIKDKKLKAKNAAALLEHAVASTHRASAIHKLMGVADIEKHLSQIGAEKLFSIFRVMCTAHINKLVLSKFWEATKDILQPYLDSLPIKKRANFLKVVLLSSTSTRVTPPMQSIIATQTNYKVLKKTEKYLKNSRISVKQLRSLRKRMDEIKKLISILPEDVIASPRNDTPSMMTNTTPSLSNNPATFFTVNPLPKPVEQELERHKVSRKRKKQGKAR